jgi:hypothetical protein
MLLCCHLFWFYLAALFFLTYESVKHVAGRESQSSPVVHMCAASAGEVVSFDC